MRIRQFVFAAQELEGAADALCTALDLEVCYRDPAVADFGLANVLMRCGETFLEVVSPTEADTAAGRFMTRNGGDGGYMVIFQTDSLSAARGRLKDLGVRVVWEAEHEDISAVHLHPRDIGGAIVSIDEARPPKSWRWAGPEWGASNKGALCEDIIGIELSAPDPLALGERWSEILALPLGSDGARGYRIDLDDGEGHVGQIRFVLGDTHPRLTRLDIAAASSKVLRLNGVDIHLVPQS